MLSIITPHFNDIEGIRDLYLQLKIQTSSDWEWIIVDDCSCEPNRSQLEYFFSTIDSPHIKLVLNIANKKASACRNQGAKLASYDKLIFLDSDDSVSSHFVANRNTEVGEFVVFQNFEMCNGTEYVSFSNIKSDFLNNFLKAKFAWQTSAILWNAAFFRSIGGFDEGFILLEDIDLSIRALIKGSDYKILTKNKVDFYYKVTAIDTEKRTAFKVCDSVEKLLVSMDRLLEENDSRRKYLSSYYYLAVRYFARGDQKNRVDLLLSVLKRAKRTNSVTLFNYVIGYLFVLLFHFKIMSNSQFIKFNRYFFK